MTDPLRSYDHLHPLIDNINLKVLRGYPGYLEALMAASDRLKQLERERQPDTNLPPWDEANDATP